jgi:iron complex outermembrane receptor protein
MSKIMRGMFVILLFIIQLPLFAQKKIISGKVVNEADNEPLSGVSVILRSSQSGVITNNDGNFKIEANPNDVLLVSIVGFSSQSIPVKGRSEINISLKSEAGSLSDVVLVGSRGVGRAKTETAVPVDVIKMSDISLSTAKMDVTSILNVAVPSLNYNKQSGSDGADHIDIATLRGLSPDQTLVLINGKRRHPASVILLFGTRGTGSSGTDLNGFPASAINRVEVLRDGASAQYGSDAIAGVINLVLKKDIGHFKMNVGYSGYNDPKFNSAYATGLAANQYVSGGKFDGQALNVSADGGFALGKRGGFMHLSGDFTTQGKTFRQVLKSDDLATSYWSLPINSVRRANGDGSSNTFGGFMNMEIPVASGNTSFYAFGGYNYKNSDDFAYTRTFSSRPDRFPTDPSGKFIPVPSIIYTTSGPGGTDTVFNPHIQTRIQDVSLAAGIKGESKNDWKWDLSNTIGDNDFHFYGDKTFNASLGATKNHFDDGGFNFLQNTSNLNFSKLIKGVGESFNLALGAEYRLEQYRLKAGEIDSYKNYDPNGVKAGGAQGFPGYQPNDEVNATRSNVALYVDGELDVTKKWLVDGAVRAENYSDFGFTSNYKLATRYKLTDNFNLRGSVSTGFRAPSLQQINFSSTLTAFRGNQIVDIKISPNYSPITRSAGIPSLKQEKSVNASIGFAWKPFNNFSVTVDGYYVHIKDRIVLSGQFDANDATLDPSLIAEMQRTKVNTTQFFANAVNTTNTGVDIVLDYKKNFGQKHFNALLTGNVQHMSIDKINVPAKLNDTKEHQFTFFDQPAQSVLLASAPASKFALNLEYGISKFAAGVRFTYFGKVSFLGSGVGAVYDVPLIPTDANPNVFVKNDLIYAGKITSDIYTSYKISKNVSVYAGADNILNVHPDLGVIQAAKDYSFGTQSGGPWDAVQMGENGRRLFVRVAFTF